MPSHTGPGRSSVWSPVQSDAWSFTSLWPTAAPIFASESGTAVVAFRFSAAVLATAKGSDLITDTGT